MSLKALAMRDRFLETTGGQGMLECTTVSVANRNYSFRIISTKAKVDIRLSGIIL